MQINTPAPDFSLQACGSLHPKGISLSDYRGRLVVVNFWSAECPWCERADQHLAALAKQFAGEITILPVASNLNESHEFVTQTLKQRNIEMVLLDKDCALADAWGAQTTPHAFLVDSSGILRYQGAVDDVTFRKRIPERFYVEEALRALLAGRLPEIKETQPYGCTIVRHI